MGCGEKTYQTISKKIRNTQVVFLNASEAFDYQKTNSNYINKQIQQLDVSIVLEKDLSNSSLEDVRKMYLNNLSENTLNWTDKEVLAFTTLLDEVFEEIKSKTPKVLPDTLYMIKTTGNETIGKGAMYTMSKSVSIPKMNTRTAGWGFLAEEVKTTLMHEIFHVYSNTNKAKRVSLYSTLGFYPIDLRIEEVQKQIIANPDADYDWAIELEKDGSTIEAVLLTYSLYEKWEGSKSFTGLAPGKGYLKYGLFEVTPINDYYQLTNGLAPIRMEDVEDSFRSKIGQNTDYIWAVEEIIADTYPLIFEQNESASDTDKQIISHLETLLK